MALNSLVYFFEGGGEGGYSLCQLKGFFSSPPQELCSMKLFSDWPNATNKRAWCYEFDVEIGVKAISCHAVVNEHAASLHHIIEC
jgi:hypothetical protein